MSATWRLRPGWSITQVDGELRVRSDTRAFSVTSSQFCLDSLIERIRAGTLNVQSDLNSPAENSLISALVTRGMLIPSDAVHSQAQESPLAMYFTHVPSNPNSCFSLKDKRVAILGLGGIGAGVLQHLVGSGLDHFLMLDFDLVSKRNLELQFIYRVSDVDRPKTDAAADYVHQRSSTAEIVSINRRVSSRADLLDVINYSPDLVVICIDDPPEASFDISAPLMWENRIPTMHGGVMIRSGFFGPLFDPRVSPNHPYSFPLRSDSSVESICRLEMAFSPVNSTISALIAAEVIHFLCGATHLVDFVHRTFIDLDRGVFTKVQALRNNHVP